MHSTIYKDLATICSEENVFQNEPMKKHTTFRIGGNADYLVTPKTIDEFTQITKLCTKNEIPMTVIGNGSNLLVSDNGIEGITVETSKINKITVNENFITCECGASLSRLASEALKNSLTGLEFASGIPGTIGGAVMMNAGAYGGEMSFIVKKTYYCNANGEISYITGKEHDFSYRHSFFSEKALFVLKCQLELSNGNKDEILARMKELSDKRISKQPLNFPSAGSAFKRPEGYFAAKLIQDSGLKGFCVNDAQVSEKHCGFIINKGNATADDVHKLIEVCHKTVFEKFGVEIKPEIRFVGRP